MSIKPFLLSIRAAFDKIDFFFLPFNSSFPFCSLYCALSSSAASSQIEPQPYNLGELKNTADRSSFFPHPRNSHLTLEPMWSTRFERTHTPSSQQHPNLHPPHLPSPRSRPPPLLHIHIHTLALTLLSHTPPYRVTLDQAPLTQ